jgi:hypothetical protein
VRTRTLAQALLVPLALSLAACSDGETDLPTAPDPPTNPARASLVPSLPDVCGSSTFPFFAGQDIDVGTVSIANDEDYLYVSFETIGGWEMVETHVAADTDPDLIPKAGKRLAPGRFPEKAVHDPTETIVHYAVPIPGSDPSEVVVAAHADVVNGEREEGAWVEGSRRDGGGWASYALYDLAACDDGIGPDGGTVQTDAGSLEIPPGALTENVEITAEPVDGNALPEGVLPGTAVDLGPDGQEFAEPVILTISYDDTGLTPEQEENLAIHLLQGDGTLLEIPSSVDAAANEVTAEITHFSVYSVALPEARLELRVSSPTASAYSGADETIWAGYELQYTVLVRNLSSSTIPGDEVTVTFDASGPVAEFGLSYSTGTCDLVQPDPSTYEFTCTLPNDIGTGTAGTTSFSFVTDPASAGASFDVSAGFTYDTWAANTGTVSTDIIEGPTEADMEVFVDPDFAEVPVGAPASFTVHAVNGGPAQIEGATLELEIVGDVEFSSFAPICQLDSTGRLLSCPVAEGSATLPSGFGENWTVEVTPTAAGESQLIATLRDIQGATDPNGANNSFEAFIVGVAP